MQLLLTFVIKTAEVVNFFMKNSINILMKLMAKLVVKKERRKKRKKERKKIYLPTANTLLA